MIRLRARVLIRKKETKSKNPRKTKQTKTQSAQLFAGLSEAISLVFVNLK